MCSTWHADNLYTPSVAVLNICNFRIIFFNFKKLYAHWEKESYEQPANEDDYFLPVDHIVYIHHISTIYIYMGIYVFLHTRCDVNILNWMRGFRWKSKMDFSTSLPLHEYIYIVLNDACTHILNQWNVHVCIPNLWNDFNWIVVAIVSSFCRTKKKKNKKSASYNRKYSYKIRSYCFRTMHNRQQQNE